MCTFQLFVCPSYLPWLQAKEPQYFWDSVVFYGWFHFILIFHYPWLLQWMVFKLAIVLQASRSEDPKNIFA